MSSIRISLNQQVIVGYKQFVLRFIHFLGIRASLDLVLYGVDWTE